MKQGQLSAAKTCEGKREGAIETNAANMISATARTKRGEKEEAISWNHNWSEEGKIKPESATKINRGHVDERETRAERQRAGK